MFFASLYNSKPNSVVPPTTEFVGNGQNIIGLQISAGTGNDFVGSSSTIPVSMVPHLGNDFVGSSSTIPVSITPGEGYDFVGTQITVPLLIN